MVTMGSRYSPSDNDIVSPGPATSKASVSDIGIPSGSTSYTIPSLPPAVAVGAGVVAAAGAVVETVSGARVRVVIGDSVNTCCRADVGLGVGAGAGIGAGPAEHMTTVDDIAVSEERQQANEWKERGLFRLTS